MWKFLCFFSFRCLEILLSRLFFFFPFTYNFRFKTRVHGHGMCHVPLFVGYIRLLIWLDSVGSSFIHYIYKVKGYVYCLTGSKANERGCHRYIDYLFSIKPSGDLLIFFFVEICFGRILRILNISPGIMYTALTIHWLLVRFKTLKMWYGLFV